MPVCALEDPAAEMEDVTRVEAPQGDSDCQPECLATRVLRVRLGVRCPLSTLLLSSRALPCILRVLEQFLLAGKFLNPTLLENAERRARL